MIYIVNGKYYYTNLDIAISKAKAILEKRANAPINYDFKITKGKKGGYCVALQDNWEKVGNSNLLKVIIQSTSFSNNA
jgi:hypothetical protein